jgi:hypothetical protein
MNGMQLKLLAMMASGFLFQAGCSGGADESPPQAAVQGTVLLDQKPLPIGIIRFVPQDATGGPKVSANIKDGSFALSEELGPRVGTHRVEIESTDDGGFAMDDEMAILKLRAQRVRKVERIEVPPVYNRRSQLEAVIVGDQVNELDYQLSSDPRKHQHSSARSNVRAHQLP